MRMSANRIDSHGDDNMAMDYSGTLSSNPADRYVNSPKVLIFIFYALH